MFGLHRNTTRIFYDCRNFAKLFSAEPSTAKNGLDNKIGLSSQQIAKILEILNESSPIELSRYNIPLPHIKNLTNWKSQRGPFKSLTEVLEVEDFQENILKMLGESVTNGTKTSKFSKRIKHLVVPDISGNIFLSLNSAVAIHLEPTGIGLARLEKSKNVLTNWICENFSSLPQKMMPTDTFHLALDLLRKTPPGDVYIFEGLNSLSPQAQGKQATVTMYNQKVELSSMLLALINTSVTHNLSLQRLNNQEPLKVIENRVFYLRPNIPARLFGTLIGSEKVSAVTAINRLLAEDLGECESLPYTPVIFDSNLKRSFFNQSSTNKELLAQALMLSVSFMDLQVRKKSTSFEALSYKKRKVKIN